MYIISRLVVPNSLRPHGLQPTRLLCPRDFPGKDTGVGCHFLLQEIFPTQGSNPGFLNCRQILYQLSYRGCSMYQNIVFFLWLITFHCMYSPHIVCYLWCWWTLDYFQLFSIVNNAAVNIVHWCTSICFSPVFNSFEYTPWSSIAGSCGNLAFKYLRNCQTDFHSRCTILHSHLKVLGF